MGLLGVAGGLLAGGTQGYMQAAENERKRAAEQAKQKGLQAAARWKVQQERETNRLNQKQKSADAMALEKYRSGNKSTADDKKYASAAEVAKIKASASGKGKAKDVSGKISDRRDQYEMEMSTFDDGSTEGGFFSSAKPATKVKPTFDDWYSEKYKEEYNSYMGGLGSPGSGTNVSGSGISDPVIKEGETAAGNIAAILGKTLPGKQGSQQDMIEPAPISMNGDTVKRETGMLAPSKPTQQEIEKLQEEETRNRYSSSPAAGNEKDIDKLAKLNADVQKRNIVALGKKFAKWSAGGANYDKSKRPDVTKGEAEAMAKAFELPSGYAAKLADPKNKELAYKIYKSNSKKKALELAKDLK